MAEIFNMESNTLLSGTSGDDTIQNGGYWDDSSHDGGSKVTIDGGAGNDEIYNSSFAFFSVIDGGAGDDYIVNRLSINVTIDGSAGNDIVYNYGGNRSKIIGGGGNDSILNVSYWNGYWYGVSNVTIDGNDGDDYIDNEGDDISIDGGAGNDSIGNTGSSVTITGSKGNDSIKIYGENNFIKYRSGDGNDKIYGFRTDSTLQIAGSSYSTKKSGDNVIVTVGDGKISLMGAASLDAINIETENDSTLLSLDNNSKSSVTVGAEIVTADATARTSAIKLTGNKLDNTILGGAGKDSLYGKEGDDYLAGGAGNDKLSGYTGNDTLWGGSGNDTLTGGDGDDLFIYSAGKDVIADYAEGDMISIGAAISSSSVKGSDATFTIGSSTLTVKDGKGKEIVFIDAEGNERTIIGGAYIATDSSKASSTLASGREVGDATERTTAIKLTGNALDNTILGGAGKDSLYGKEGDDYLAGNAGNDKLSGYTGDDTLWGGKGNDTLTGGDGADIFLYKSGEGKDVISDFGNDDMLLITGAFSASYDATKNSISFKVDSTKSAITLKNFTATNFNVNGFNYRIKDGKFVMK